MAGSIGLTDVQAVKYAELTERKSGIGKPLTANMEIELAGLQQKKDFPELPTGAKTYCKKWLKETLYRRRTEISSKYIQKGNACEEDGFTLAATQLNLGMVFKNTLRRKNTHIEGEWDLLVDGTVYDNKASWSLDTFPMFETKPDADYVWQLQGYMDLTEAERAVLAYTLNDAPIEMLYDAIRWVDCHRERAKIVNNMVFTEKGWEQARAKLFDTVFDWQFIPIPDSERIKTFAVARDNAAIGNIYHRVNMCRSYIGVLVGTKEGV